MLKSAVSRGAQFTTPFTKIHSLKSSARPTIRFMASASGDSDVKLDKSTSKEMWKSLLSAEEYNVLRDKGTERPFSENYEKFYSEGEGFYVCRGCKTPLYTSEAKFSAGCGWPALYEEIPGTVERHTDVSGGMSRTEITCANCGGHLGHEFKGEGFKTPTDSRHCVNYVSIKFEPKQ